MGDHAFWSAVRPIGALLVLVAMAVVAGPALSNAAVAVGHASPDGQIASYALQGEEFSWMLPLENQSNDEQWDGNIEDGMWRPLYAVGIGSKTGVDYGASIGKKPVYSDHDKVVTITMNHEYTWSDGTKVTSADVKFFFQLDQAGKHTLGEYVPGEMPDDITSVTYPGPYQFVLHLNHAYNPTWFTGDQLTWIMPLPAQAWDKTCANCAVGDAATTPAGAKAVFEYLFKQSESLTTYATNPLWRTVDGPWVIDTYDAVTFAASFSANRSYTGPTKPKLAGYKIYTFTTGDAEVDALRSGSITFGYLPETDVSETGYFTSHGFTVKPWRFFYNEVVNLGYTSKTWGPLFRQLYIRQALQRLITEQLYIRRTLHGYGLPDYGPVADYPGSRYVSPTLRKDPYPYNPKAAARLLAAHGWVKGRDGIDVCKRPGTGAKDCGSGIASGKRLSFTFLYEVGTTAFLAQVSAFETAAKSVGVGITLDGQTLNTMVSLTGVCPTTPPCNWSMAAYYGYFWPYTETTIVPTGKNEFGKGNYWSGGYYSATAQRLIDDADGRPGLKDLYADEDFLSKDVPTLWWPLEDSIVVVKKQLKGWEQLSPYGTRNPSQWYFSR